MKRGIKMYNNYYPYNYPKPPGIFSNFRKLNWAHLLDGTQKTLGVINQAIPLIYQIKPLITNAKTAFRVVNAIKNEPNVKPSKKDNTSIIRNNNTSNNSPTYFL